MIVCPYCGKKIPNSHRCPKCGKLSRNSLGRKIPVVTAIIALAFCGIIILGVATAIIFRRADDTALHLCGTWEIESPTFNDEHITYVFKEDSFVGVTEMMIFDAGHEVLEVIREFHMTYTGAAVKAEDMGGGNFLLRLTVDGTFVLDGNTILFISGEGLARAFSFYWESDAIVIDGYRYLRR